MRRSSFPLLAAAALFAACDQNPTDPDPIVAPESALTFVRFAPEAELAQTSGSFWAVKGDHRRIRLDYVGGETFLEFDVPGDGLYRAPDGTLYQSGDSVLISVQVDDAGRFLFTFSPSGLEFHPEHPAELRVRYAEADPDFDDDGDVDSDDDATELEIALWKQEIPGTPWVRVGTAELDSDFDEVEADIDGFTSFSLASN